MNLRGKFSMKWPLKILFLLMLALIPAPARTQTIAVTAVSDSAGATVIATAPLGSMAILETSDSIPGFWITRATHNFEAGDTWQYQDLGVLGAQRFYRLRLGPGLAGGNVYSVNVAGFTRIAVGDGITLLANPLMDTNNTVATAFRSPVNGYSLFRLTGTGFEANNYLYGWTTPAMPFAPGEGFFLQNASGVGRTNVFFGEVPTGNLSTPIVAGQSLLSSKVPQGGSLETALGFPADYDMIFRWNPFFGFSIYYHEPGYWEPNEPSLNVGEAFWLATESSRTWTRSFSPNFALIPAAVSAGPVTSDRPSSFVPAGGASVWVNFFTFNSSGSLGRVFQGLTPVGGGFVGQLFATGNNSEASLVSIGSAVPFQSGPGAGYINSGLVSVPGISPGQTIYLQLRVWEIAKGATYAAALANGSKAGKSAIFAVTAIAPPDAGPTGPPPSANGFVSFVLNGAPPTVARTIPVAGANVTDLTSVAVTFSESVQNVNASDLLVNGIPAMQVIGGGSNYLFTFPQPPYGLVIISWAPNHGITDFDLPSPGPFNATGPGAIWGYTLVERRSPVVRVDGAVVNTSAVIVTNSTILSLQTTYPGGSIFYTLNGAEPGTGLPYSGPILIQQSATVRAIAYDAGYTESAESDPVTITVVHSPSITQQPQTQTVLVNQGVVFNAQAVGDAPLAYQWFFNDVPLGGAIGPSFARDGAAISHTGSYWVVASNPYGGATSSVAGLTVLLRPSIATEPRGTNINSGQSAQFCVSAVGSAPLAFQWRRNGVNIPGATSSCLLITNVQAAEAGAYSVVVGNGADAVTSAEAALTLLDVPTGPAPDNFADRFDLFGSSGSIGVTNIGATKEADEPDHAGKPGTNSVWYRWTPETDGIVTFQTVGSAFDTLLAVYVGEDLAGLIPVASNEDGGGSLTSQVRFNATHGVAYQIALDGFAGAQGDFVLTWTLEETAQVLPVITGQPASLTVIQGASATFSVSASGTGLRYQWYFNNSRLNNETNTVFTRTNVQSAEVGYYLVAVTNNQQRGVISEAAVLEIGPFASVRSVDKVEDLLGGGTGFQPASGFASVTIGSLGTQVLNTTNSTTSFRETNHCGVIGGSSRWFKLKAAANGLMSLDTLGSTFDTVLAAYTGDPLLGGYPTKLIECNDNADAGVRWSRLLYPVTNAIDYLIAVDGVGSAAGTVQLNWSLGLPPVIISNPPPIEPLVREGEALQLTTALTNGLPPPRLQWYRDGQPIADATNATYSVETADRLSGGVYTVVAYNSVGSITGLVANVSVEVPFELNLQPVQENGQVHFRVSGTASQTFILQGSTNFVNWQPLHTNSAAGSPVSFDDHSTTNRARRYYRALPWP
jgi:hypothetical protein